MIKELGRCPLPTEFGDWTYIAFRDDRNIEHEMLVFGNINDGSLGDGKNVLVRMHSSCHTNEIFHAINCECRKQLQQAMRLIQKEKKGIIIYLNQEGRGNGLPGKIAQLHRMFDWKQGQIHQRIDPKTGMRIDTVRAYEEAGYPSDTRDFSIAGEMLKHIGVTSVRLLTNNPKKINGVKTSGIGVIPVEIHILPDNEIIAADLKSKARKLGHIIKEKHWQLMNKN